jgi:hypothetical protein
MSFLKVKRGACQQKNLSDATIEFVALGDEPVWLNPKVFG